MEESKISTELEDFLKDENGGKGLVGKLILWNKGIEDESLSTFKETEVFKYLGKDKEGEQKLEEVADNIKDKMEGVIEKDKMYFNPNTARKIFHSHNRELEIKPKQEFERIINNYPVKSSELDKYIFFDETTFDIENGLNISIITQILDYVNILRNSKIGLRLYPKHFSDLINILLKKYLSVFDKEGTIIDNKLYYSLSETYNTNTIENTKSNKIYRWSGIPTHAENHYNHTEKLFLSRIKVGDILINYEKPIDALTNIFYAKYLPQTAREIEDTLERNKEKYYKIIKYISFNEYFDLLLNGKEDFYIHDISSERIWNGYKVIDNPDYVKKDIIFKDIPEKRKIIAEIQEIDIIKDIGGFEAFVQQEKILLKDIMKSNELIKKLYDSLIYGEYFSAKNN